MQLTKILPSLFSKVSQLGLILTLGMMSANAVLALSIKDNSETNHSPLANGTYLYGESPQPDKIGKEYIVFRVFQNRVIGAFYLPYSEFSCFYGNMEANQMKLSIVDPYDKTVTYDNSIAFRELSPIAASDNRISRSVGLEGYHQINQVSQNDRRILNTCLEEYR